MSKRALSTDSSNPPPENGRGGKRRDTEYLSDSVWARSRMDMQEMPDPLVADVLAVAGERPDAEALVWRDGRVTNTELAALFYRELDQLAQVEDGPIALLTKKTPRAVALTLACMATDRPVLLVSTDLGSNTISSLLEQARCRRVAEPTDAGVRWRVVESPCVAEAPALPSGTRLLLTTSGSSGVPKLVPIGTGAIDRFTRWAAARFLITADTTVFNYAPLNFDLCLLDIWATLRYGGRVALVDSHKAVDPRYLHDLLTATEPHVVQAVPMMFRILAASPGESYYSVRHVLLTGDHTPRPLREALPPLFPRATFHNVYGCTETNDSFLYSFDAETAARLDTLPLGRPLPGVRALVISGGRTLEGAGTGELWVSTPFQSSGYLQEEGPGGRFVTHTVAGANHRYFRTGDVVSRDDAGQLTLMGRTDFQVKVRGVRVNVEEVERVLLDHSDVAEAGVVALPDDEAGQRLHAAVRTSPGRLDALTIREHCAANLARPAIPSVIRIVHRPLPVTPTGKVHRNRLRQQLQKESL